MKYSRTPLGADRVDLPGDVLLAVRRPQRRHRLDVAPRERVEVVIRPTRHGRRTLPSRAVRKPTRSREVGRGEKVIPGVWRLRLPLPWPGVPHCNAWALAAGPGVVLVDTGMHEPGSMAHLERALDQAGLKLEHVRLIVCTHAHVDHCGQAPAIAERAGCEVWMHENHAHHTAAGDPEEAIKRRVVVAHQSGVPADSVQRWVERRRSQGTGQAGTLRIDRELTEGDTVSTDLGDLAGRRHARSRAVAHLPLPAPSAGC